MTSLLRMREGRRLACEEFGAPEGVPAFYFHGWPGSRLEGELFHDVAARAGLRILALDRPGIGRSDPQPRRAIRDWPADVAEAASQIGLERYAVFGYSAGGPYVAACAVAPPPGLVAAAMLAGAAPFTRANVRGRAGAMRAVDRLARWLPWALPMMMRGMGRQAREDPEALLARVESSMPPSDREALRSADARRIMTSTVAEGARQGGRWCALEHALAVRPWGFPLSDIRAPLALYQGTEDTAVPLAMARAYAEASPHVELHAYAGAGHLSVVERASGELVARLVKALR